MTKGTENDVRFFFFAMTYNRCNMRKSYGAETTEPIALDNEGEPGMGGYEPAYVIDGMRDMLRSRAIAGRGGAR